MPKFFNNRRLQELFKARSRMYFMYAIGEIFLVVVGILIALQIDNWSESRKEKALEIKSLKEVVDAIENDLYDINENIIGFSYRIDSYKTFLKYVEEGSEWDEILQEKLTNIKGITTFISNIGPYETLKSRGLTTITNDELRLKIASYYDIEYERLYTRESRYHEHFLNYIKPSIMKYFKMETLLEPVNYVQLQKDFQFKQIIIWELSTETAMLTAYDNIRVKAEDLIKLLEEEIERLDS